MTTKAFTRRPPDVDPRWWAQASWTAKQRAVRVHRAASRPDDEPDLDVPAPRVRKPRRVRPEPVCKVTIASVATVYGDTAELGAERLAAAYREAYGLPEPAEPRETWRDRAPMIGELMNDHGVSPESVAARFGVGVGALEKAMRRADRPDLARPFARLHTEQRRRAA